MTEMLGATAGVAAHMALLGGFPLLCVFGVEGERWREVLGGTAEVGEGVGGLWGVVVGGWLGAVPIPLGEFSG